MLGIYRMNFFLLKKSFSIAFLNPFRKKSYLIIDDFSPSGKSTLIIKLPG